MKPVLIGLLLALAASAQTTPTFDSSGNSLLKGTYYFREVFYIVGDQAGDLSRALALYGNVTFSGTGTYGMSATVFDSNGNGFAQALPTISGTYSISASGYGFLSNPLSSGDSIFGLVGQKGIFIGSSTENVLGFNDMFVAAPLSSPAPTNASFKGSYWVSDLDLSSGSPLDAIGALYQLNPDGAGSLGNVAISGYYGQNGSAVINQTDSGVKYTFTNGAGVITFPTSNALLISGQKYLYISPDGNFVFGGSPFAWDMFVGVRTTTDPAPNLSGLYYQAGIDEDDSALSAGYGVLDTYFGAANASAGSVVGHQRLDNVFLLSSTDYTYTEPYTVKSDGTYSTPSTRYVVGAGGVRIGSGIGPFLGLNVAIPAPSFSGTGVYLNPQGVVNAASYAPFTAGIAPGELLNLYGSNLSNVPDIQIASTVPLPTTLAGTQVLINGVAAPIYYVTPGAVSVLVPYGATTPVVSIQVNNNGVLSNTVTSFSSLTAPGVLTNPSNGIGAALALHSDYSLVNSASPAKIGETISVFLTGLGAVTPAISDGAAGPTDTFAITTNTISAYVGNIQASVGYAGLAPGYPALYQLNLTIPTGLTAGSVALDIQGPDAYTSEATIAVAAASTAQDLSPAPQSAAARGALRSSPKLDPKARVPRR